MRRSVMWCFLVVLAMASLEGLAYFTTRTANSGMGFAEYVQRFSGTSAVLLVVVLIVWAAFYLLAVRMGGVRMELALFFVLSFFLVFGYLLQSLDFFFTYSTKYEEMRPTLLVLFFYGSLGVCGTVTLALAYFSRRFRPLSLRPRWFMVIVVLLMGLLDAVWLRGAVLNGVSGLLYWLGFVAVAAIFIPILAWLGKTPRRLAATLGIAALMTFAPLPWTLSHSRTPADTALSDRVANSPVRHIVLVTVDALRRDVLGCYSGQTNVTPRIDEFAQQGVVFQNAFSAAPWTYPSLVSMLTGLPPRVHMHGSLDWTVPEGIKTLAQYLHTAGYATASFGYNHFMLPRSGMNRGFDEYLWFPMRSVLLKDFEVGLSRLFLGITARDDVTAAELTDYAINWHRNKADQSTFLWVHYLDPHTPYAPPEAYLPSDPAMQAMGSSFSSVAAARGGSAGRRAEERAWIRALYEGEVRSVDAEIGRLFDGLRQSGIYDDALILLTADHGEELWDHGRFEHGHTLFNELVHVPLVVKLPRSNQGAKVESYVTTPAITSTVLELCGIGPETGTELLPSIAPLLREPQAASAEAPIFSGATVFSEPLEGVIFDRMKYVRGEISGHELLFNLDKDPDELNSVAVQEPDALAKGRQFLESQVTVDKQRKEAMGIVEGNEGELSEEDVRSLKSMGYL